MRALGDSFDESDRSVGGAVRLGAVRKPTQRITRSLVPKRDRPLTSTTRHRTTSRQHPSGASAAINASGKSRWSSRLRAHPRVMRAARRPGSQWGRFREERSPYQSACSAGGRHRLGVKRAVRAVLELMSTAGHRRFVGGTAAGLNPLGTDGRADLKPCRVTLGAQRMRN